MSDDLKRQFKKAASKIERVGVNDLLAWLEETDFYRAPCSTFYHLNVPEGLVAHSLNVQLTLEEIAQKYVGLDATLDDANSRRIVALFHDLCKVDFYVRGTRNVKKDGRWVVEEIWKVEDKFPLGHGEKSAFLVSKHIDLTPAEMLAIRWHMGPWEQGTMEGGSKYSIRSAINETPLLKALMLADVEATFYRDDVAMKVLKGGE